MDHNLPTPPKLQLQGRRPSSLRVTKDSHKIMKPPPPPLPPREPVIIHTISPKVIHVEPANFMGLVQRLTGTNRATADPPMTSSAALELPVAIPVQASPPLLDLSIHSFLHDMSPVGFQVSRTSPGNFASPNSIGLSPGGAAWDISNQFQDF